jgi:phage shock protein C
MTAPRRTKFYLNKQDAKWSGVCSGMADYTGIDAIWIRLGMVLLTISLGWPILAYFVIAWVASSKPVGLYSDPDEEKFWQRVRANPARTSRDVRAKFRDIDRRLADMELLYTSENRRLADEIDALR